MMLKRIVAASIIIGVILLFIVGCAVNAAPLKKATVFHRSGDVEVFDDVKIIKPVDTNLITHTSVIYMEANGTVYKFYNAEIMIEEYGKIENT